MRSLLVTVSVATGVLLGVRAVFSLTFAGAAVFLEPTLLPVESLGITWSDVAIWPREMQLAGVVRLLRTLGALGVAAAAVGTLNVTTLLAERSSAREHDFAVRLALGARSWELVRPLLREIRTMVWGGVCLGTLAGIGLGAALRLSWPGGTTSPLSDGPWDLLTSLAVVVVAVLLSHVGAAIRTARSTTLGQTLRSSSRTGWDPATIFARRLVSAVHVSATGTVVVSAWAFSLAFAPSVVRTSDMPEDAFVLSAVAADPQQWRTALADLAQIQTLEAESLAAPGALEGLGIQDIVITECGQCSIGMLPAPLWNAWVEYHAVSSGFFDFVGVDLLEGRSISTADVAGAPLVALVSRRLAYEAFEDGQAVGKRLRVGNDHDTWYRVVGIVEDRDVPNLGEDGRPRGAVYLSAHQRPPASGLLLLRGDPATMGAAIDAVRGAGIQGEDPIPLHTYMASTTAPLLWSARVLRLLGLLTAVLAAHGIFVTALFTTRRRARDIAVRTAVGASHAAIARFVLLEKYRTTGWGLAGFVFFGTLASAPLQRAGGVPAVGPLVYAGISSLTFALVTLASVSAVREALGVEPARLLD